MVIFPLAPDRIIVGIDERVELIWILALTATTVLQLPLYGYAQV